MVWDSVLMLFVVWVEHARKKKDQERIRKGPWKTEEYEVLLNHVKKAPTAKMEGHMSTTAGSPFASMSPGVWRLERSEGVEDELSVVDGELEGLRHYGWVDSDLMRCVQWLMHCHILCKRKCTSMVWISRRKLVKTQHSECVWGTKSKKKKIETWNGVTLDLRGREKEMVQLGDGTICQKAVKKIQRLRNHRCLDFNSNQAHSGGRKHKQGVRQTSYSISMKVADKNHFFVLEFITTHLILD